MSSLSESDEELELHDIDPDEESNSCFNFIDPYALSPMIRATVENNITQLLNLIGEGKSINVNDNQGNTPLHYAVLRNNHEVVDVLIAQDDIRLDVDNFDGSTPLLLAVRHCREYCAKKLIEKGADVNCADNTGQGALHFLKSESLRLGQLLIENGAVVNCVDYRGDTPLSRACSNNEPEVAHLLLYYGADPTICNIYAMSPLVLAMENCPDMEEVLFNYTFDEQGEKTEVDLVVLEQAIVHNSSLFSRILERTSDVLYDEATLDDLIETLPNCNLEMFQLLLQKFDYLAKDLFGKKDFLNWHFENEDHFLIELDMRVFIDFLYMVFAKNPHVDLVVQNFYSNICIAKCLIMRNISIDKITGLFCCMMSYGVQFTVQDLDIIYCFYHYCELFRILTHVELRCTRFKFTASNAMPVVIYDVRCECFDVEKFLRGSWRSVDKNNLLELVKFFAFPRFKRYCMKYHKHDRELLEMENVRSMPSLVELSRNVARKYIIKKFDVETCAQFNSVLNKMQINNVYTRILTYQKELYTY